MNEYLEESIEKSLRTHGYEDDDGRLEALQRQVDTLQMALARVTALLVEKGTIGLDEYQGPEYLDERHFMLRPGGA